MDWAPDSKSDTTAPGGRKDAEKIEIDGSRHGQMDTEYRAAAQANNARARSALLVVTPELKDSHINASNTSLQVDQRRFAPLSSEGAPWEDDRRAYSRQISLAKLQSCAET